MRRAAKTDSNHAEVIQALRAIGASVADTSGVGRGFPDVIAGFRGLNFLFEIKHGALSPSRRRLTPDQVEFQRLWRGQYACVLSPDEAISLLTKEM